VLAPSELIDALVTVSIKKFHIYVKRIAQCILQKNISL
jgi:hypothetical protein